MLFKPVDINPQMVTMAREARSLTQLQLAEKIGCKQGTLSKVENGTQGAKEAFLEQISHILNFPVAFFRQSGERMLPSLYYYRKKSKASSVETKNMEAYMNIVRLNFEKLLTSIEIPERNYQLWDVNVHGSPSECAKYIRDTWRVPKGRLNNLTELAENNGIILIHLNTLSPHLDGLTMPVRVGNPIIFVNGSFTADRVRATIAHEIGHLVLHHGQAISKDRDVEKEAWEFAGELLMPANDIKPFLRQRLTIQRLAELKMQWKVSMQMILYRAQKLGAITDSQYRAIKTQLNNNGFKTSEPQYFAKEIPSLASEIIGAFLNDLDYSMEEMSELLCLHESEIKDLYLRKEERLSLKVSR